MTTRELLEMASLDALGLLDEQERESFDRAFRAASASVQRQVRREQLRLTSDESILPVVNPPAGLRDRVLAAVRDAMRSVARTDSRGDVLARLIPSSVSLRRNVSPLWRAACVGFATATIVLLTAGYSVQREWRDARAALNSADMAAMFNQKFGSDFTNIMFDRNATPVSFAAAEGSSGGEAVVWLDVEGGMVYLMCRDLPVTEGTYRLAIVDENGKVQRNLVEFAYRGGLQVEPRKQAIPANMRMAILTPNSDEPYLVSLGA